MLFRSNAPFPEEVKPFVYLIPLGDSATELLFPLLCQLRHEGIYALMYTKNPKMQKTVRECRTTQGAIFDRIPGKPFLFFIYSYFIKFGWLDGRAGFNYALALSFYYWQISIKVLERKFNA